MSVLFGPSLIQTLTRQHVGQTCTFDGFDGKSYAAVVSKVRKRMAVLDYQVKGRAVRAYLATTDLHRVRFPVVKVP